MIFDGDQDALLGYTHDVAARLGLKDWSIAFGDGYPLPSPSTRSTQEEH